MKSQIPVGQPVKLQDLSNGPTQRQICTNSTGQAYNLLIFRGGGQNDCNLREAATTFI